MTSTENATYRDLLMILDLEGNTVSGELHELAESDHRYVRDLKINLSNALKFATLSKKETALIGLAVALNEDQQNLKTAFRKMAIAEGATQEELNETAACVSLLQVNNIFYRFRHFTKKEFYETTPAGIKMSIMLNPVMGKEFFELMSLCVSALNGCEQCVVSHEQSVLSHGGTEQRIYDAIRLTSVLKGLGGLTN